MPSGNDASGADRDRAHRCPSCGGPLDGPRGRCAACGPSARADDLLDDVDDLLSGIMDEPAAAEDFIPGLTDEPAGPRAVGDGPRGAPAAGDDIVLDDVDNLLEKISNPDTLFEVRDIRRAAVPEPAQPPPAPEPESPPVPPEPEPAPEEPPRETPDPGEPKKPRRRIPRKRQFPDDEDDHFQKIRRITMVERKRRATERRRGGKVQCGNCKQIFDLSKLPGQVDKCLNCGSKALRRSDDIVSVGSTEFVTTPDLPFEEEEDLFEEDPGAQGDEEEGFEGDEDIAEAGEEDLGLPAGEEILEAEAPPADAQGLAQAEEEDLVPASEGSLVSRRKGHKDYYEEYRDEENIYADMDLEAARARESRGDPAGDPGGEFGPGEGPTCVTPGGWGEALRGKLEIRQRAEDEAVLRDDYFLGKKVKNYLVLEILGRGGMGTVFKAKQEDGDLVALKILPPMFSRDASKVDRFLKEAEAASKLDHPNIVQCYDYGRSGDVHFIAMELVQGRSVGDLIKDRRAVKITESLRIIREAARGLNVAHERGIIHRDIKPDNILITPAGTVQVADFGLARDMGAASFSGTGEIVGTPYYISPEQIDCQDVDARADIYSLGATIYHLITGKRPFEGSTPMEVLLRHMNEKLVPPVDRNPLIPVPVSRLISKMMQKNRAFRYQSCEELIADIDRIESGSDVNILLEEETEPRAKKVTPPALKRNRLRAVLSIVWVILIVGGAVGARYALLPELGDGPFFPLLASEEAARAELQDALAFLASHPEDPVEARRRLEAVIEHHGAHPEGIKAGAALERLERDQQALVLEWIGERKGVARGLKESGVLGRALLETLKDPPAALAGRPELATLDALGRELAQALAERDGMVLIRGGTVRIVRDGGASAPVQVASFLIGMHEVSNREYLEFVQAEGARPPWPNGRFDPGEEDLPVAGVDADEAEAYAKFRGRRLPTEEEWQRAAAGDGNVPYPWGNAFEPGRARCRFSGQGGPAPVASHPEGRTPTGLFHMAGNVHEWTASPFAPGDTARVARGGGWESHPDNLRTSARARVEPSTRDAALGFRLAANP